VVSVDTFLVWVVTVILAPFTAGDRIIFSDRMIARTGQVSRRLARIGMDVDHLHITFARRGRLAKNELLGPGNLQ
jgi:hypothetical protein